MTPRLDNDKLGCLAVNTERDRRRRGTYVRQVDAHGAALRDDARHADRDCSAAVQNEFDEPRLESPGTCATPGSTPRGTFFRGEGCSFDHARNVDGRGPIDFRSIQRQLNPLADRESRP